MRNSRKYILKTFIFSLLTVTAYDAQARCQQVRWDTGAYYANYSNSYPITQTEDGHAAKIRAGQVHIMDPDIQPIGTVLTSTSVPPTEYKIRNANPNSLLWACSPATDMSKIRYLTSVNGDDRVGGYFQVDPANAGGETNVFYTWFVGVGIRQVMGDKVLSRAWDELPIEYEVGTGGATAGKDICQTGWYCIRLKHLPTLQFELVRVAGLPPHDSSGATGSFNRYCNDTTPSGQSGDFRGLGQSGNYNCAQPASYITLGHTGQNHLNGSDSRDDYVDFPHDTVGVVHSTQGATYRFWGADNGFGYTLYNAASLINDSVSCKLVMDASPVINFNEATTSFLDADGIVSRNFYVDVKCHDGVQAGNKSGTTSGKIAIGIMPSQGAYNAANVFSPSLVNSSNGVAALLSNNYGTSGVAKNVGIYIKYQGGSSYLTLLGQPGQTGSFPETTRDGYNKTCGPSNNQVCYPAITSPQGPTAGWYPVINSPYSIVLSQDSGYTTYRTIYTADLKRITGAGKTIAGTVNSTAYVIVKFQ